MHATVVVVVVIGAELLVAFAGEQQIAALDGLEAKVTVGIGGGGVGFHALITIAEPGPHLGVGHGLAAEGIKHESFHPSIAMALAHHDGEITHPKACVIADVVAGSEVFVVAADQVIKTLRQAFGGLDRFDVFVKILGGRQLYAPFLDHLFAQESLAFIVVQPLRIAAFAFHGGFPIFGHNPEVNLIYVAVFYGDIRARIVPNALDGHLAALGLDLIDEVVAHGSAGTVGVGVATLNGNLVRLHLVAFLVERLSKVKAGAGANTVVGPLVNEALESGAVTVVLVFAVSLVFAKVQPAE